MLAQPLEPPRRPFLDSGGSNSSRSSSPGGAFGGSTVSLHVNYVPSKFAAPAVRNRRSGIFKRGGGIDAFRAGESRIPGANDDSYDGVELGRKGKKGAKWNRFKCSPTPWYVTSGQHGSYLIP
ncbi:hypothetical protein MIND_01143800 [Mycena indigotica]|uniref:Uncharacterized protein n=1 Tax=Mycena indigotica TaxID=2126181 RepID=A0A8H6VTR9_9AGAR|nr:uncharacterized protein MIND_01143800 [Mycena indigotica]KAF7293642.1 hypothetical protein MIND_01143800 [Mycena indigotica]